MVEFRRRTPPRHGIDHDLKPLPSFPGFCLPARPLGCRQEEHRSRRATAQGFDGSLLALPFAGEASPRCFGVFWWRAGLRRGATGATSEPCGREISTTADDEIQGATYLRDGESGGDDAMNRYGYATDDPVNLYGPPGMWAYHPGNGAPPSNPIHPGCLMPGEPPTLNADAAIPIHERAHILDREPEVRVSGAASKALHILVLVLRPLLVAQDTPVMDEMVKPAISRHLNILLRRA